MFDACLLILNEVISYDPSVDAGITRGFAEKLMP